MTQITAKGGTIVIDYYPIQNWNKEIYPDEVLRVLSFKGSNMNKRVITKDTMREEISDRVDNFTYEVTDSAEGNIQYATNRWVESFRKEREIVGGK